MKIETPDTKNGYVEEEVIAYPIPASSEQLTVANWRTRSVDFNHWDITNRVWLDFGKTILLKDKNIIIPVLPSNVGNSKPSLVPRSSSFAWKVRLARLETAVTLTSPSASRLHRQHACVEGPMIGWI